MTDNQKIPPKIKVRISKTNGWYKKGEVHEVLNYVTFGFFGSSPCFEINKETWGIDLKDCEVLTEEENVPEYTIKELTEKIGHTFKIKK